MPILLQPFILIKKTMNPSLLPFIMLFYLTVSIDLRDHKQAVLSLNKEQGSCKIIEKTTKSFNNNCLFRYTTCQQSPDQIDKIIDCTYCQGQKDCPYLKYLSQVQCIQSCCPFQSFFLASMSPQRLKSCVMFTQMQIQASNWVHNEFFFPFLIVLIVLLIITLVFLLVKTVVHIWNVYVNKNKRNQNQYNDHNHDNTTQEHDGLPEWVMEE